jgi:TetR/AcrR family transcriptional regulator, tetracycline repressor protein
VTVHEEAAAGSKGRKRGGTLRISREGILDAAKKFDPQTITMQAVADELGVDRKALNYHVTDRDGLLRLVAADVFESNFMEAFYRHFDVAESVQPGVWRKAMYAWASAVRDGLAAAGVLANYFVINSDNLSVFEPAEIVLQQMQGAGFDATSASRGLIFMTHFAMGVGRDEVLRKQLGTHPQSAEVHRLLDPPGEAERFEALRVMMSADLNSADDAQAQFDFEIDIFIRGMEQLVAE